MTEPRRRRPSGRLVLWGSVLLFAALFALLTYRLSIERSANRPAARAVQVRKVIKRRVVTTIVPSPGRNTVSSGPAGISSSYSSAAEPVVTSAS